jgi:hypothetical protein
MEALEGKVDLEDRAEEVVIIMEVQLEALEMEVLEVMEVMEVNQDS